MRAMAKPSGKANQGKSGGPLRQQYIKEIEGCSARRQWKRVLTILSEMQKQGVLPDNESYHTAMRVLGSCQQWRRAVGLLNDMPRNGVAPTVDTFNTLIEDCAKAAQWEHALQLLQDMPACQLAPVADTYAHVIAACEHGKQVEHAVEVLTAMRLQGFELETCALTQLSDICECEIHGDWQGALSMVKDMLHEGPLHVDLAYSKAISACRPAGRWQEALSLLEDMRSQRLPPSVDCYTAALRACETAGEWPTAFGLLHNMQKKRWDVSPAYGATIGACERGNQVVSAMSLPLVMEQRGVPLNSDCYRSLLNTCRRGGMWERALALLRRMSKDGVRADDDMYGAAIGSFALDGLWERALRLLRDSRQSQPSAVCYIAAAEACYAANMWENALQLLGDMQQDGLKRDVASFSPVIRSCVSCSQVDRAADLTRQLREDGLQPRAVVANVDFDVMIKQIQTLRADLVDAADRVAALEAER